MRSDIIMIGMPASGKTTIGQALSASLGFSFIDTDRVLEKREHMALREILDHHGVEYFLEAEEAAILDCRAENTVIATGGSVALSAAAMHHLGTMGTFVFLDVGYFDLKNRIQNMDRRGIVFRPGQGLLEIYEERKPLYEKWADLTVKINDDDGQSSDWVVSEIAKKIGKYA